jgi:Ferritin-like domain
MNRKTSMMDRRRVLKGFAASGAGMAFATGTRAAPTAAQVATPVGAAEIDDDAIFNFVLNLEYLEAEYYLLGTTGVGVGAEDLGANPGSVTGGALVPFETDAFRQFAEELAANELAHVRYYREVLGSKAVDRPTLDLTGGFAAVAQSAGLGADFDPFSGEISFFLGGMLFEDVGVTGYKGATPLIQDKTRQEDIAGVLGVEAYHMGMARSLLYQAGEPAIVAANAITVARGVLNGMPEIEQGIEVDGRANVVPSDDRGIVFSRTPGQVLQIVYLTPETGVSSGGFFPDGVNGDLATT